jgi:hypothetical protein
MPVAAAKKKMLTIKHELGIRWSRRRFRVKLGRKVRTRFMGNTLVGTVVGVGKECLPARLESRGVDVVAVILRRDVALASLMVCKGHTRKDKKSQQRSNMCCRKFQYVLNTGWFCPRLPKGNFSAVPPAANPMSWLPMQIP